MWPYPVAYLIETREGSLLALISIIVIFMILKFNLLVYCTQQVVLDLCFHMTKAIGNIFSICEIFHHIVSINTFQFSDVSIVSRRMTNIGSTMKGGKKKTLELGIQRKERQVLLYKLDTRPQYFEQIPLDENQPFPLNPIS